MKIIDGKKIAEEIQINLKKEVVSLKEQDIVPGLAIILVGNDPASEIYVKNKLNTCQEMGINAKVYRFSLDSSEEEIIAKITELNQDWQVDGILVQCPLPSKFNESRIIASVSHLKDVDGFGIYNLGCLLSNKENVVAATPLGILKMLEYENIDVEGKHVVMVGASLIVGRPMAIALLNRGATVSICHTKTRNLKEMTREADILIVAIGQPKYITADYVKDGAVVIDVGTNRVDGKVVGDVDFADVALAASAITPVPGGVGPMTITMLIASVIKLAKERVKK